MGLKVSVSERHNPEDQSPAYMNSSRHGIPLNKHEYMSSDLAAHSILYQAPATTANAATGTTNNVRTEISTR